MVNKNTKFLLVDDSATIRRIIRNILKDLGFNNVDEAGDGILALQRLTMAIASYQFVVTDWHMPNMDGLLLLQKIRSHPMLNTLPVLMVSSETHKANIMAAIQAGASGYIVKPFTAATFSKHLEQIFVTMKA